MSKERGNGGGVYRCTWCKEEEDVTGKRSDVCGEAE